jgi:hypothetical protein
MASQSGWSLLGLLLSIRERDFAALANSHRNKRHVLAALAHGPPVTGIIWQRSVFRRGEQVLSGLFDQYNECRVVRHIPHRAVSTGIEDRIKIVGRYIGKSFGVSQLSLRDFVGGKALRCLGLVFG